MTAVAKFLDLREMAVDVVESGARHRKGAIVCRLDRDLTFETDLLESFSSTNWQAIVYDALVLAAAVEFCDRSLNRSKMNWGRRFDLSIPVHDPERWREPAAIGSLVKALELLTGDSWQFEFRSRRAPLQAPAQSRIDFNYNADAVIAFSEGMDSRAVAGLEGKRLGNRLVRVRVTTKRPDIPKRERAKVPFAALPYAVNLDNGHAETSARSRGFKFTLVAAIGAYLINAPTVIVPESGQGALAPALLPVGQCYPDYRNHPAFTAHMEKFIKALLGHDVRYRFPRLWTTKGQTLREFIDVCGPDASPWVGTRSCWQQSRHASVSGSRRQCGVCAACMLRRLSVHAAQQEEAAETYVWESLSASIFEVGANRAFEHMTNALREYALAAVLHLDHFATLAGSGQCELIKRRAMPELARSLSSPPEAVNESFEQLLSQHAAEWSAFTNDLGPDSFVRKWIDTEL